jgi:restriction system protein
MGISDAQAVIRRRFLTFENPREALRSLTPFEFELLVGALYKRMGYSVTVTSASGDGGVDVIAEKVESGARALILIQCKLNRNKVKVQPVRELTGVVLKKHANKGVLITNSTFTSGATREADATPTIELIGYRGLNELLNQNLGTNWPDSMAMFIRDMKRNFEPVTGNT